MEPAASPDDVLIAVVSPIIDRRSQYAPGVYQALLAAHGLVGSMSRRGNPCNNAKTESFMKTLKVEVVYPMTFGILDDIDN